MIENSGSEYCVVPGICTEVLLYIYVFEVCMSE